MYPWIVGTDAEPGALVQVKDEDGIALAEAHADSGGAWSIHLVGTASGTATVYASQRVDGRESDPGEPLTYSVDMPPEILSPSAGSRFIAGVVPFRISMEPGTILQRQLSPTSPLQMLRIPSSGEWNEYIALPSGRQEVRVRYADSEGHDFGPWAVITVNVQ